MHYRILYTGFVQGFQIRYIGSYRGRVDKVVIDAFTFLACKARTGRDKPSLCAHIAA